MKKIVAIIQPAKFDAVKNALIGIVVEGMTAIREPACWRAAKRASARSFAAANTPPTCCPRSSLRLWFPPRAPTRSCVPSLPPPAPDASATARSSSTTSKTLSASAMRNAARTPSDSSAFLPAPSDFLRLPSNASPRFEKPSPLSSGIITRRIRSLW